MRARPIHAAIAAYVLLAIAIQIRNGYYTPVALGLALAAFGALVLGARGVFGGWPASAWLPSRGFMAAGVVLLAISGLTRRPIVFSEWPWFTTAAKLLFVAIAAAAIVRPSADRRSVQAWRACYWAVIVAAFVLRALVIYASPSPRIDVWVTSQESAGHLLAGQNPYTTEVSDPYEGESFGYDIFGYMYPPATLYLQLVGFALGDVRWMSVLGELAMVLALFRLLRGRQLDGRAELVPLLFLAHPRGLIVIEQAWTEPLILLLLAGVIMLYTSGRRLAAAAAYGFMLSLKHSMAFSVVPWVFLERRPAYLAVGVAVGLATLVPFAIWDWSSLWTYGVLFHFGTGYRPEALTIFAPLAATFGIEPTRAWTIASGLVATAVTAVAFRKLDPLFGYLWAVALTTFAMFLFGNKAYTNYYYLVGGLLVFLIAEGLVRSSATPASRA